MYFNDQMFQLCVQVGTEHTLAGWLVHLCCNNSLMMAPWCWNM